MMCGVWRKSNLVQKVVLGHSSEGSSQSWRNDSEAGDPENTACQGKDLMAAHLGMWLNTIIDSQNHTMP